VIFDERAPRLAQRDFKDRVRAAETGALICVGDLMSIAADLKIASASLSKRS